MITMLSGEFCLYKSDALRMGGQESDLESIVSSDVSMFGHDHNALR